MNSKIYELGCKAGLLNYIDHETPRVYFIDAHADLEEFDAFCNALTKERDDEIERLRKALQDIAEDDEDYRYRGQEYRMIARAALEEKE